MILPVGHIYNFIARGGAGTGPVGTCRRPRPEGTCPASGVGAWTWCLPAHPGRDDWTCPARGRECTWCLPVLSLGRDDLDMSSESPALTLLPSYSGAHAQTATRRFRGGPGSGRRSWVACNWARAPGTGAAARCSPRRLDAHGPREHGRRCVAARGHAPCWGRRVDIVPICPSVAPGLGMSRGVGRRAGKAGLLDRRDGAGPDDQPEGGRGQEDARGLDGAHRGGGTDAEPAHHR